jgi:hypothetical protein
MAAERTRKFLEQAGDLPEDPNAMGGMQQIGCVNLHRHLADILSRIRDDCKSRLYYQISPESELLLDQNSEHFGKDVSLAFGAAAEDIAEAAACLALERTTACVFHLMRSLEIAVAAVADKIGATIVDKHGRGLPWGQIANNMRPVIDKMMKGSEEQIKWYRIQDKLDVVARAWRNPTAHPKQTYTLEEAKWVFGSTKAFMQELAPLV